MSRSSAPHTPAHGGHRSSGPESLPLRIMRTIEETAGLDRVVAVEQRIADVVLASPRRRRLLQGQPVGHPLHPPLTDLPIGFWLSSTVLDLGGAPFASGADRLLALGVVSAVPAALTGLADWGTAAPRTQRVGVVHAAANSTALVLYATSLVQRRRGRRRAGVALSLLAGASLGAGAFLGGHLSVLQGYAPDVAHEDA